MYAFIETLNMSGPDRGDAYDELNTQMRETARFQAMQSLDATRIESQPIRRCNHLRGRRSARAEPRAARASFNRSQDASAAGRRGHL